MLCSKKSHCNEKPMHRSWRKARTAAKIHYNPTEKTITNINTNQGRQRFNSDVVTYICHLGHPILGVYIYIYIYDMGMCVYTHI